MATQTITHENIRKTVRTWPSDHRLKLVQDILKDISSDEKASKPTPKNTVDLAYGLIARHTNQPTPTDEEVQRWLEEERMKKYGLQ